MARRKRVCRFGFKKGTRICRKTRARRRRKHSLMGARRRRRRR